MNILKTELDTPQIPATCRNIKENPKANFFRNLLADQKLTQVDVQAVMKGTSVLVKSEVEGQLQHAISLMESNGCSEEHVQLLECQLATYKTTDLFQGSLNNFFFIHHL